MKMQYVCPKDPDEILFEEEQGYKAVLFKNPLVRCPKCGEYYFREQCPHRDLKGEGSEG